jgi:ribosome-associated protein
MTSIAANNMSNTSSPDSIYTLVQQMVRALDDKKAGDLRVLKVAAKSTITDYLVLATGNSDPHLRALRIEVERVLDAVKHPIAGMEVGGYGSGWTVVDAYQIMAHIFTPEQRSNYALEKLWKDAEVLNIKNLLAEPKVTKPAAKPQAKKAVVEKAVVKKVAVKKVAVTKAVKKTVVKKAAAKPVAPVKKAVAVKKTVAKKVAKKVAAKKTATKKAK